MPGIHGLSSGDLHHAEQAEKGDEMQILPYGLAIIQVREPSRIFFRAILKQESESVGQESRHDIMVSQKITPNYCAQSKVGFFAIGCYA